jgi:hypothetical protein
MIVKHENRIRALEALVDTENTTKDGKTNHASGDSSNNNVHTDKNANSSGDRDDLAPDEV